MWAGSLYCTSQITPYVASYYGVPKDATSFVFPSQGVVNTVFMFFGSKIAQRVHPKLVLSCIGIWGPIFLWLSSFAPSFYLWWALYLVAYGIVNGLTYMTTVHHAWKWFPDKSGLASGIIMSGYGFSGLVFNNLSLVFVNPTGVSANSEGVYPEDIAANVPHMLRCLSYCYVALIAIAVCLVFPGPAKEEVTAVDEVARDSDVLEYLDG